MTAKALEKLLTSATGRVFPAWQALVLRRGETVFHGAGGKVGRFHVDEESLFDLASLTKALCTSVVAMHLVATDRLPLDVPVSELLRRPVAGGGGVTARRLLAHCAGYPAWRPLFLEVPARGPAANRRAAILDAALATPLAAEAGTVAVYSDVGFLVLTALVEQLGGERVDRLFARLAPESRLAFRPLETATADRRVSAYVPTEDDPKRGVLAGRVNDENAWAMGGVSGHAGLFGSASAVAAHAALLVDAWHGRGGLVPQPVIRRFWTRAHEPELSTWALGWDTPSGVGSSAGADAPAQCVGHLGFTGGSVWIDPDGETIAVLLTNRVWPDRTNDAIRAFRPRFHQAAWELAARG